MDVTKVRFRLGNDYSCAQVTKVEVVDGKSLSEIDLINIQRLAQRVVDLSKFKSRLQEYLQNKMSDIAPNLTTLIGEVLCACLISHVGSLTNLAMCPASTLQILGAEKALFSYPLQLALKTRGNTPKYGLIFNSSFIGRASRRNKGRMACYLAKKCSFASRIDCFSGSKNPTFGKEFLLQFEEKLEFYETEDDPQKVAIDIESSNDPEKEPVLNVMNTVVSSMSLDYPPEKLNVYLSDDAGSPITLCAIKAAALFAKSWIPFCRKHKLMTCSPELYFDILKTDQPKQGNEFLAEEKEIKEKYNVLKEQVENAGRNRIPPTKDRPSHIEIIHDDDEMNVICDDLTNMPRLVYVAREKRHDQPHHYKAGALNALLRVSGVMSNSPYILVLDCDMYCNDPSSARQAMCFHLDTMITKSLAFVQFPQRFYKLSKNDIYDSQIRRAFKKLWQGMDGIQGPVLSGTGFYLKRRALYGGLTQEKDINLYQLKANFGSSNKLLSSLQQGVNSNVLSNKDQLHEAQVSDPWFIWFVIYFTGGICHHLFDVFSTGESLNVWWNEMRMGWIKCVTCNLFGCLDAIMNIIGIKKRELKLTNKAVDKDELEKYKKGNFELQGEKIFLVPLVILVLLNIVSFIGGIVRVVTQGSFDEMFGQVFLSFFISILNYPIIKEMVTRKKNATA
ncbi:hypothetical protein GIB67_006319 [Kingdonia uniflora]|uniref:Nucleolar protein 56 n=1 Tax=Kingdonia uniflora TaxID=39325 RepID=A0A7J7P5D5_9MAGN|nr:hypothetical protein GIB67_006319 [Kingdonia uniflora]